MNSDIINWTEDKIYTSALKYNTRYEWSKNDKNAYDAARRFKILDLCCAHMIEMKHKWTEEELLEDAKKYNFKIDWEIGNRKAYNAAKSRKILDKCCAHMKRKINPFVDDIGIIYGYFFNDNSVYIGLSIQQEKRHKYHLNNKDSPVFKKIKDGLIYEFKIIEENIPNEDLSDREIYYISKYRDLNYMVLNKDKGGTRGNLYRISNETIRQSASTYISRNEWKKNNRSLYEAARLRSILIECCAHMKFICKKWTDEEVITESQKFNTYVEWSRSRNSYEIARKRGLLQQCRDLFNKKDITY